MTGFHALVAIITPGLGRALQVSYKYIPVGVESTMASGVITEHQVGGVSKNEALQSPVPHTAMTYRIGMRQRLRRSERKRDQAFEVLAATIYRFGPA